MSKDPTLIEHCWLMQMLGNFGAKQNLYFLLPSVSKIVPAPLRGTDIYRHCKRIQHFSKKIEILLAT